MPSSASFLSGNSRWYLNLAVSVAGTNEAANTSDIAWSASVSKNLSGFDGNAAGNLSWSLTLPDGTTRSGSFFYSSSARTVALDSGTVRGLSHNNAGELTATMSGSSSGDVGPVSTIYTASGTVDVTSTNFVRPPSAPFQAPGLARSSNGVTITINSAPVTSPVTVTEFQYRWSTDGTNWSSSTPTMGADRYATFTGAATTTFHFQTRAISSEGAGPWSASSFIVGIPTSPASISASRVGRSVTVTAGSSTGSGILGYFVQYSTDGSTWSTAETMTGQSYTYTNLTPALNYTFRVYSQNSIGPSGFNSTAPIFVPAGGRRYDVVSGQWLASTTAKRYDPTDPNAVNGWVDIQTAKRWDGSAWVDLS